MKSPAPAAAALPALRPGLLRRLLALVVALGLAAPPGLAVADPDREKQALVLAEKARAHYHAQEFAQAADLFLQAYGQVAEPTLVFNAARAYQQAGQLREARPLFRLYLRLDRFDDPESREGRREAEGHLRDIEQELARQEAAARTAPSPAPSPAPTPAPAPPAPPATGPAPEPVLEPPPPAPPTEPAEPVPGETVRRPGLFERVRSPGWSRQQTLGAASVGTGGVLLITAVVLGAVARGNLSDFETRMAGHWAQDQQTGVFRQTAVTQREAAEAFASHDRQQLLAGILAGTGLAAIGVGTALWLLDDGKAPGTQATQAAGDVTWRPLLELGPDGLLSGFALRF